MPVHPTAVVEEGARIDPGATVGPFALIDARVRIGAGTVVGAGAVIAGETTIGARSWIGPHAVLGTPPQIRETLEAGALEVGDGTVIRELATVHAARPGGRTRVGSSCLLMAGCHVAHDCQLADHVELANGVQLAGHVEVERGACLGGLAAVHQFARIGAFAFVGAGAMVSQDVPPYCLASGDRARIYGLNVVGLRRNGIAPARRRELARAVKLLFAAASLGDGLARVSAEVAASEERDHLLAFVSASRRGLCRGVLGARRGGEEG
ncbi:MAG: acyl-ACP--UDP-N-acetylglucosamine O-acyltransferase [Acidobacteriota bacterium]